MVVIRVVNRIFSSNTYLLHEEGSLDYWLVDIGDVDPVLALLSDKANAQVRGVFLTHSHFDHIYGINDLCSRYPECVVYASDFGKEALYDAKKNLSRYHEQPIVFKGENVVVVGEGDAIPLFAGERISVIATPGHCPSSLTFYTNDYVFTGDAYIPGVEVVTKLPRADRQQATQSVARILQIVQGKDVCPGHGGIMHGGMF